MAAKSKRAAKTSGHDLEGKPAPEFALAGHGGATVALKDATRAGGVVLYFYPKDMTPGCTKEACDFRDNIGAIKRLGAQVIGISADPPSLHQKFAAKYELAFPLLSDPDHRVAKAYGVYKLKSLYGREFMGIERTTFVIDKRGTIRRVFPKVKVDGHAAAVVAALKELK